MDALARRVELKIIIDGIDATSHFAPCLLSFEYTDQAAGKSDEVQLTLHDRDDFWLNGALPDKGSIIQAGIHCLNWHGPGKNLQLACGSFKCDEPAEYSGPPNQVSVKAVSAALTDSLRETARTKGWENFSLQGVASEIASRHGLTLEYDAPDHQFKRQDQRRETDLAFLQRLAKDRGVNVKVHDGKLVMFSAQAADAQGAALSINRRNGNIYTALEYSFKLASEGTGYDACQVEYHEPENREVRKATFSPGGKQGKILTVDERVESEGDAQVLAKSRLRDANKKETTGSITVMGHPGLVSGLNINLVDFGLFSGLWFVEKTTHSVGDKYTTSADIRRTLAY